MSFFRTFESVHDPILRRPKGAPCVFLADSGTIPISLHRDEGESRAMERAVAVLNRDHKEIFSRLQIRVFRLQRWTMDDVTHNMAGGSPSLILPKVPRAPENRDYQNACQHTEHFHNIFESTLNQSGTVTDREFVAFFNVLRCFDEDSKLISADSSSALKTSNFIVKDFELRQETPWNFPIFIDTHDHPNVWCQFHPRSDFMERYVVTHTTPTEEGEEDQEDCQVSIAQKEFDLTTADGAVTFLREMYNLVAMLEELAKHLGKCKQGSLVTVNQDASEMISLTSKAKRDRTGGSTLASIVEDDADEEPQDDLGVFGTDAIQAILKKMNYKINFIPAG
ncbi:hypothetical protein BDR05DRAFT_1026657, partial [Suillus weaverae]